MTIKELLLSKPDARQFRIDYQWANYCKECKRSIIELDEEYSADGTAGEFRQQVEGSCTGFNHYRGYDFVYEDYSTEDMDVTIEETETETIITITKQGEPQTCEECEQKHLDELAEDAEEPEREYLDGVPMPTAEEIAEAARKQKELLAWAQGLTEEQINALSDFGYYNSSMKGYTIRAAQEMGMNDTQIQELLNCFAYALSMMTKEEAEQLYIDR